MGWHVESEVSIMNTPQDRTVPSPCSGISSLIFRMGECKTQKFHRIKWCNTVRNVMGSRRRKLEIMCWKHIDFSPSATYSDNIGPCKLFCSSVAVGFPWSAFAPKLLFWQSSGSYVISNQPGQSNHLYLLLIIALRRGCLSSQSLYLFLYAYKGKVLLQWDRSAWISSAKRQ